MCRKKCRITDIWEKTTECLTGLSQHQIAVEGKSMSCVDTEVYTVNYYNANANRAHHVILQLNSCLLRGHQYYSVCCDSIFMIKQSHNKSAFITSLERFQCVYYAVMDLPQSCFQQQKISLIPSDTNLRRLKQNSKLATESFCLCIMNMISFLLNQTITLNSTLLFYVDLSYYERPAWGCVDYMVYMVDYMVYLFSKEQFQNIALTASRHIFQVYVCVQRMVSFITLK